MTTKRVKTGGAYVTSSGLGAPVPDQWQNTYEEQEFTGGYVVDPGGGPAQWTPMPSADTDKTPSFTFVDQTGVPISTVRTSAAATVSGINVLVPITVSGGSYDINSSGVFVTYESMIASGQTVRARHTSSNLANTAVNTVVTIGLTSDTFTSTTAP